MGEIKKATFAGGCFWCMVKPFDEYPGVESIATGYTGGHTAYPTYEEVCGKGSGHKEAVQIRYDEAILPYEELVELFFRSIDPTDPDGQFHDRGTTYHTAIFYHDEDQREAAQLYKQALEDSGRFDKPIVVPIVPAQTFYLAEKEHQEYYKKHPYRYKMYYKGSGRKSFIQNHWTQTTKDKDLLREKLTPIQYKVTQENGTEVPYDNIYNDHYQEGIYVDVVSGKPLFSSADKFPSGCGWPAFSKAITPSSIYDKEDESYGMHRFEVRSVYADSHLGHVFEDGPKELGGLRYCINSAALRFVPKEEMEIAGYGAYLKKI